MSDEQKQQFNGYVFKIKKAFLKGDMFSATGLAHALYEFLKEVDPENAKRFK